MLKMTNKLINKLQLFIHFPIRIFPFQWLSSTDVVSNYRFMQLIGVVPTDCAVLARMGEIYDNDGDKSQAFQYYYDVSAIL